MTPELFALALAALLQVGQIALMALFVNREVGTDKTASPRDPDRLGKPLIEQVSPRTGRMVRAMDNHFEGLILFSIAALTIAVSGQSTALTAACAWIYLAARALYVPAYVFGWVPWRSAIWGVGLLATVLMLLAALL